MKDNNYKIAAKVLHLELGYCIASTARILQTTRQSIYKWIGEENVNKNAAKKFNDLEYIEFNNGVDIKRLGRKAIELALKRTNNNKRKAAFLLNISERTLYRKIKSLGK